MSGSGEKIIENRCRQNNDHRLTKNESGSHALIVKFSTDFPEELEHYVGRDVWIDFITELNQIYAEAENLTTIAYLENILGLMTCHLSRLCFKSLWSRKLEEAQTLLYEANRQSFVAKGVCVCNPLEKGFRVIEKRMSPQNKWFYSQGMTNGTEEKTMLRDGEGPGEEKKRVGGSLKDVAMIDEMEDRLEDAGLVKAPDGGYGWVVVFASFCTNAIVDGVVFTVSASLVPRWEKFFQNDGVTAVTSLLAGFYLLSGPLASALANNFGCNIVAISGSLVAAVGFLISALLPALPILYLSFGIIGGVGFGLIFLPAIVIVGQYFSERRAMATGIAVCGSGIGTALFGKLTPFLLDWFTDLADEGEAWRLFLLFLSATSLLCAFFGYFFKPLKPSKSQLEQVVRITAELMGMDENERAAIITSNEKLSMALPQKRDSVEAVQLPFVTQGVEIERFDKPSHQNGALARKRRNTFSNRPFLSTLELLASRQAIDKPSASNSNLALEVGKAGITDLNRPLSRMDIFYIGSTTNLASRLQRREATIASTNAEEGRASVTSATDASTARTAGGGLSSKWTRGIIASIRPMLDLSLLQSPTFVVLALTGFLTLFCFFVPFAFIGALADERIDAASAVQQQHFQPTEGTDSEEVKGNGGGQDDGSSQLLLVLLGLFNVLGRVFCGFISDHPKVVSVFFFSLKMLFWVDPLMLSNMSLIVGGIATAIAPFLTSLWMFALYCLPFAFGAASFAALRSIICVELLGIDRLTSAFGMLMLFMGVAALLGPPFAKILKNWSGDYGLAFHIMGLLMALSGLLGMPLRRINEWERAKERKEQIGGEDEAEMEEPTDQQQK
uniref:Golgin subfamily A member 7/ERF4 domain-containing protein n=1 Tax=Globodera rostochiensis TaxID=31243 RepID=A0A914H0R8_GLORO